MSVIKSLELFYERGTNPKHYSLLIAINQQSTHSYLISDADEIDIKLENSHLVISVEMTEFDSGVTFPILGQVLS